MIEIPIRQQDGSTVIMRYVDNVTNRMFADFVRRHEPFGGSTWHRLDQF